MSIEEEFRLVCEECERLDALVDHYISEQNRIRDYLLITEGELDRELQRMWRLKAELKMIASYK